VVIYVIRGDAVVEKAAVPAAAADRRSTVPSPRLSPRLETFESPVTGKPITSWRERDRDMDAAGAVDRRDIPKAVFDKRREIVKRNARAEST
jgi:hypothetical protein